MLVAYPAAIPVEPLISKLGNLAGKTVGSFSVSSKLATQLIVFLSISFKSVFRFNEPL